MAEALLEVRWLGKRFGALRALDGVDVTVRTGSFHGLIGPNGSGKSTLAKVMAGHPSYELTSGDVLLDGQSIL